jgi:hypothetical protein
MNSRLLRLKLALPILGAGLLMLTLAMNLAFAAGIEFLDAKCLTWNSCAQCVEGLGPTIGQSDDVCFAAVGGFGNGTAQHCIADTVSSGKMCRYKTGADPGTQQCAGAAVYLCDVIDDLECICECNGSADLSGVILTDTTLCETL